MTLNTNIVRNVCVQCGQIGLTWMGSGNKFWYKSSSNILANFLGYLKYLTFQVESALDTFWASFGKNWPLFIPTSAANLINIL